MPYKNISSILIKGLIHLLKLYLMNSCFHIIMPELLENYRSLKFEIIVVL